MKLFDAHFHIIDPRYPLVPNQGFLPASFTAEDYLNRLKGIELLGGAVVSGSFQGFDQEYLVDTLKLLGPQYVGVANIPKDISRKDLDRLHESGVKAIRFNLFRGSNVELDEMEYLCTKLFSEYGWHAEFYLDGKDIPDLLPLLRRLPKISIDHLGMRSGGLKTLYGMAEKGVRIKATGFGRLDFDPIPAMKKIHSINPQALIFGTDLPSTRAAVPFSLKDIDLINSNFSENEQEKIFYSNAKEWYGKML